MSDTVFVNGSTLSDADWFQAMNDYVYRVAPKWCGAVGGTANVLTAAPVSPSVAPGAYAAGQSFAFVVLATNTGAATLNVSTLGAKNIFFNGAAMTGGELIAGAAVVAHYDGTRFQVVGPVRNAELAYAQITSDATGITGTNFAGSTGIITLPATTFDGSACWLEFFCSTENTNAGAGHVFTLSDGGTDVGILGDVVCSGANAPQSVSLPRKFTPSAGVHTYSVTMYVGGGSGIVRAGAGTIGANSPAFLRITRA